MKAISCVLALVSTLAWGNYDITYTADNQLKAVFKEVSLESLGVSNVDGDLEKLALEAILKISEKYKLKIEKDYLKFDFKNESLVGSHFRFQQIKNDTPVRGSVVSISFDKEAEKVIKFYTTYKEVKDVSESEDVREDEAIELAWNRSQFKGELKELPNIELIYKEIGNKIVLVYDVTFTVGEPVGTWNVSVDATTGKILEEEDKNIYRRHYHEHNHAKKNSKVKKASFKENLKKLAMKASKSLILSKPELVWKADGRGVIFDPNPVTTLRNDSLNDNSPASDFNAAYINMDLKDLTVRDGVYYLENSNIKLIDFDRPNVDPSTSNDGVWDNVRKDVKFNDVMTFYHLDLSMNYLKSIGYSGERDIFPNGLKADANGVGGADNSYYQPANKRLAFGHGCVDDNEDTDVILHELGHAIEDHIVGGFSGGDTGAIGEGFGDYWAASYSYTRENGDFKPNWVFKWDGHNSCWGGRKLNALEAKYDHSRRYYAHARLGSDVTDELWSTPIFQAFKSLMDDGKATYDEIQKIIIEAHYGLGSGIKMRDMATSIINTVSRLYPNRGIEEYYISNFKRHNIIE